MEAILEPVRDTEVPSDLELPPDIDLPPAHAREPEQQDIPLSPFVEGCSADPTIADPASAASPFSGVQTQSLAEELGAKTKVIELPDDDVDNAD
ncbi:hypothetical protein [[Eubacterium] cellulosolvens]